MVAKRNGENQARVLATLMSPKPGMVSSRALVFGSTLLEASCSICCPLYADALPMAARPCRIAAKAGALAWRSPDRRWSHPPEFDSYPYVQASSGQ